MRVCAVLGDKSLNNIISFGVISGIFIIYCIDIKIKNDKCVHFSTFWCHFMGDDQCIWVNHSQQMLMYT
jgi:hypothetical protein